MSVLGLFGGKSRNSCFPQLKKGAVSSIERKKNIGKRQCLAGSAWEKRYFSITQL